MKLNNTAIANIRRYEAEYDTIIIIACLLLTALAGCGAGYAYARRPAPILSQAQLLRQNYARGIYADELADAPDTP